MSRRLPRNSLNAFSIIIRHRPLIPAATSTLNARGEALVGQIFVLDAPILNGRGRIILGDGSWTVTPDKLWYKVEGSSVDDVRKVVGRKAV